MLKCRKRLAIKKYFEIGIEAKVENSLIIKLKGVYPSK